MMIRNLSVLAFAGLSACAVPIGLAVPVPAPRPATVAPPPPPPVVNPGSAKERFIRAAAQNGCVVNASTTPVILASATLSREDLARILQELKNEGRGGVSPDGSGFVVSGGVCA